jgi:hypothetical protein
VNADSKAYIERLCAAVDKPLNRQGCPRPTLSAC